MKYLYMEKPSYDPETEIIFPNYKIENDVFISGWIIGKKPDEDGYTPTPEEQPDGAPTLRERVELLEFANDDMILFMAELIGENKMKALSHMKLRIIVQAFKIRIKNGEAFKKIAKDYPRLKIDDLEAIREVLNVE